MARTLEHAHGDLVDGLVQRLRDELDVLLDRQAEVHVLRRLGPHHHLLHVEHGRRVVHAALLGDREDGQGVVVAERGQAGAVDRVDRDVDGGARAGSDLLAVVEHGRLVLLALADHHDARHLDGGDELAHRVDRGAVAPVLVAPSDPAAGRQGGGLGHADQFHGEISIRALGVRHVVSGSSEEAPRGRRDGRGAAVMVGTHCSTSGIRPWTDMLPGRGGVGY